MPKQKNNPATWLTFLHDIADLADTIALKLFRSSQLRSHQKADMTPVSEADLAIEEAIRECVANRHPELSILGEEYGNTQADSNLRLIIDPIDGTKNFIAGIPFFASLLAIECDNQVIAGLVSAPAMRDRYWGERGHGAFHNGKQIHVSHIAHLSQALALHGSLYGQEAPQDVTPVLSLLAKTYRQRGFADYLSPMIVATGCGEFAIDVNLKPWDIAPMKIIVEEAGGKFTDTDGRDSIYSGNFVVSNGLLHDEILQHIRGIR